MLRFAHDCLEPDGQLMVATGSRILVPFKKPLSSYLSKNPADTHCFRWSEASLHHAVILAGFSRVQINDYEESDWLVMIGRKGSDTEGMFSDNQCSVIDYFNRWDREFP